MESAAKEAEPEVKAESKATGDEAEPATEEKTTEEAPKKKEEPVAPKVTFKEKAYKWKDEKKEKLLERSQVMSENYKAKNPEKHAKYAVKFEAAKNLWE